MGPLLRFMLFENETEKHSFRQICSEVNIVTDKAPIYSVSSVREYLTANYNKLNVYIELLLVQFLIVLFSIVLVLLICIFKMKSAKYSISLS